VNTINFILNHIYILDETMNSEMKQVLRPKIESYLKRVQKLREILKNGPGKKEAVADSANTRGNAKYEADDDSTGPDKERMMQKFEGKIHFLNLSFKRIGKVRSNCH
jgi:hypothetical protein